LARLYGGDWTQGTYTYVAIMLLATMGAGLYRLHLTLRFADAVPRLLSVVAVPLLVVTALIPLGFPDGLRPAVAAAVALVASHGVALAVIREIRRRRLWAETTVIVGAGDVGRKIARVLHDHPEYGLMPVGFIDSLGREEPRLPCPFLGDVEELERALTAGTVSRVVLAYGPVREARLVALLRSAIADGVDVYVVPRFFDLAVTPGGWNVDEVWGIPLHCVRPTASQHLTWPVKRSLDIALAGTALVVTAPLLAVLAVAVKLSGPGPILFRQHRIGQGGRPFQLLKFRSVCQDQCSDREVALNTEEAARAAPPEPSGVTRVGAVLRKTSLDELPQLWNVLRGEMSLIGPRPERPFFVDVYGDDILGYRDRHRLPVGLSGWAQVHGLRGSDSSIEDRVRFDNYYIDRWSLWLDVVIVVRTFGALLQSCFDQPRRRGPR
jgi:exopolysaccharide biosynthesis polyprenyl glycosylphosphotransferase